MNNPLYDSSDGQDGCAKLQRHYMLMCVAKETFTVIVIPY